MEKTDERNRVVGSLSLYDFIEKSAEIGKIQIGDEAVNGKGIGFEICGQHDFMDGIEYELIMDYARLRVANSYLEEIEVMEYSLEKNKRERG